jgi:hypothetical protein
MGGVQGVRSLDRLSLRQRQGSFVCFFYFTSFVPLRFVSFVLFLHGLLNLAFVSLISFV